MRHGKKFNHLGRTASHRKAMLSNMATSLIMHKRVTTTVAKAKALRKYVEPLITKSKTDTTHSRRTVFSYLQNKESAQLLFDDVAGKVADRPGGYTRIIKLGNRLGDNAEMCMIELVDYNEVYVTEKSTQKTRRSRRGGGKKKGGDADSAAQASTDQPAGKQKKAEKQDTAEAQPKEEVVAETKQETADTKQEAAAAEKKEEETKSSESDETAKGNQDKKEDQ